MTDRTGWRNDLDGYLHDRKYRRQVHAWLRSFPWEALWLAYAVPVFATVSFVAVVIMALIYGTTP